MMAERARAIMTTTRTLHINTERTWRGGEKQTLLLVRGLRAEGHDAELVCQPQSPLARRAQEEGIPIHPIAMHGELDPLAIRAIRRLLRRGGFQVCQMHTSHAHALGVLARGLRRTPKTLVVRRVDFSIYRRGLMRLNWFKYRFGVDRYIAISLAIREVMVADGIPAHRIAVVHSGVDHPPAAQTERAAIRKRHGIPVDAQVIGNVAHLAGHKGQIHLVRALSMLRRDWPQVQALIVGVQGVVVGEAHLVNKHARRDG